MTVLNLVWRRPQATLSPDKQNLRQIMGMVLENIFVPRLDWSRRGLSHLRYPVESPAPRLE